MNRVNTPESSAVSTPVPGGTGNARATPAPRPRHPRPKDAYSPRHARATFLFPLGSAWSFRRLMTRVIDRRNDPYASAARPLPFLRRSERTSFNRFEPPPADPPLLDFLGEQDTGAGVARAWRGCGAGCGHLFGLGWRSSIFPSLRAAKTQQDVCNVCSRLDMEIDGIKQQRKVAHGEKETARLDARLEDLLGQRKQHLGPGQGFRLGGVGGGPPPLGI
eukprot:gene7684-biopygen30